MQISWLSDFLELARTRSFIRSAENRHVTHPAFGRRIKALEAWAGVALVERTKPVEFTAEGLLFLETAVEIVERLRLLRERFERRDDGSGMEIRLATGATISATFFPLWYRDICDHAGFFRATMITGDKDRALAALCAQEADLLLAYSSHTMRLLVSPARFEWLIVGREKLVPVSKPDVDGRPLYTGRARADDKADPFLDFAPGAALKTILVRHMADKKLQPKLQVVHESSSYSSLLELAAAGLGLVWLPERLVRAALDDGRLVVVNEADWCVDIDLALYRRRFFRHPVIDRIWQYCSGKS